MTGNCDIAFAALVDYVEDRIDDEARARLESHFAAGCSQCQQSLSWLRRTIDLMRTDTLVTPPRWVMDRAKKLFKERRATPSWPKRIAAYLLFDSGLQLGPAGIRSADQSNERSDEMKTRQILYGSEDFDIDFLIEERESYDGASGLSGYRRVSRPSPEPQRNLAGQILSRGDLQGHSLDYEITLVRDEMPVVSARATTFGEFAVDGLPPGTYDMIISLEDGDLFIEGLDI